MNSQPAGPKASQSEFAVLLGRMLDETGLFTRAEWAGFLGISQPAISQWVKDKTVPRADLLRMIVDIVRTQGGKKAAPLLEEYDRITKLPAELVSPLGSRMAPTIEDYLKPRGPISFGVDLRSMTADEQIEAFTSGGWSKAAGSGDVPDGAHSQQVTQAAYAEHHSASDSAAAIDVLPDLISANAGGQQVRAPWEELLTHRHCVIADGPGVGKTHLIKAIADEASRRRLPVFRIHAGKSVEAAFSFFEREIGGVKAGYVLVDGFNEAEPGVRRALADIIASRAQHTQDVHFVVASRPVEELAQLASFKSFAVAPYSQAQLVMALTRSVGTDVGHLRSTDVQRFLCHLLEKPDLPHFMRLPSFLKTAWKMFENSGVTPFSEAEIMSEWMHNLLAVNHAKDVSRVRKPWASRQQLSFLLSYLAMRSFDASKDEFDQSQVETWMGERFSHVSASEVLSLLATQGIVRRYGETFAFAHRAMRNYMAAVHVAESAESAVDYLSRWRAHSDVRDVFRHVCGITTDATSLLKQVIASPDMEERTRSVLLAGVLAQPIMAASDVLQDSCSRLVGWLDAKLANWSVKPNSDAETASGEASWMMTAASTQVDDEQSDVQRTLGAIHRARSSHSRSYLLEPMKEARSEVMTAFAGSMEVEGRMGFQVETTAKTSIMQVTVGGV